MKESKKKISLNDVIAGIIVGLISIPISMGYAQIAGLPPVYGLYGSVFPVLVYAFFTGSPQFVFGVDATPAALVGAMLADLGIENASPEAVRFVPVITLTVAGWLLLFHFLKAGAVVRFISAPVMGGFITGIGFTIILMQTAKLFGGTAGTGEIFVLIYHIFSELSSFHLLSFLLGVGTIVIILTARKLAPRFPMSVFMILAGVVLTKFFHIDAYGVKILPAVEAGLPPVVFPELSLYLEQGEDIIMTSLTVALVVMAQTLLASNSYARKYDYPLNNNREVLAYAASNFTAAFFGCPPLNGSVSRTGIADQYRTGSQLMSVTAVLLMTGVLLFGTGLLELLPVPILTGIVICALWGILELDMAVRLIKTDRREWLIFLGAFVGVLVFGTLYGVLIGVVLSFIDVLLRTISVPRAYMGVIPEQEGFYNMARFREARPVRRTLIYRFSGNLFFANIDILERDIRCVVESEKDTAEPIKNIIIDARGMGSIDSTAADRLLRLYRKYHKEGIRFYLTEHHGLLNDQLRRYGAGEMITHGAVRRTITLALRDAGLHFPYDYAKRLDDHILFPDKGLTEGQMAGNTELDSRKAEMEWAFGKAADTVMDEIAAEWARELAASGDTSLQNILRIEQQTEFGRVGLFDEDELLKRMEAKLAEMEESGGVHLHGLKANIRRRRQEIAERVKKIKL